MLCEVDILGMGKSALFVFSIVIVTAVIFLPHGFLYAETSTSAEPPPIKSELPPSPVREAVLELLKPQQWLNILQQYIRAPLPGTGVKDVEVDKEKVSELNIEISKETGVDLLKFFQFVGKVLVVILEGIAKIIRGLVSGG